MVHVNFDHIRCDFLVTSVHKSIGAPLSCGVLVMRPERAGDVWPLRLLGECWQSRIGAGPRSPIRTPADTARRGSPGNCTSWFASIAVTR